MFVYLISVNNYASSIVYDESLSIEDKRKQRPLSVAGLRLSSKVKIDNIDKIYTSNYVSDISASTFLNEYSNASVVITDKLHDLLVGKLKSKSLQMVSYFQERDFSHKCDDGESINDAHDRLDNFIKSLTHMNVAIYLPRRLMYSYLVKNMNSDFNGEDRLAIINEEGDVVMDHNEEDIEIFKVYINSDKYITKVNLSDL